MLGTTRGRGLGASASLWISAFGAAALLVSGLAGAPGDWTTPRGGPAQTGGLDQATDGTGALQWQFNPNVPGLSFSTPPALNGDLLIFAGDSEYDVSGNTYTRNPHASLYAVRASTGEVSWTKELDSGPPIALVIAGGRILLSAGSGGSAQGSHGSLFAVSSSRGDVLWESSIASALPTAPAAGSGRVFVGTSAGALLAFDAATGSRAWTAHVGAPLSVSPTSDDSTVYVAWTSINESGGAPIGRLSAFSVQNGRPRWEAPLRDGLPIGPPTVAEGRAFVATTAGVIQAFDAETGRPLWTADLGGAPVGSLPFRNGTLFGVTASGLVFAADAGTGLMTWSYAANLTAAGPPAVSRNELFVAVHRGNEPLRADAIDVDLGPDWGFILALGAHDGTLHWRAGTEDFGPHVSVVHGLVLHSTTAGYVRAYDGGVPSRSALSHGVTICCLQAAGDDARPGSRVTFSYKVMNVGNETANVEVSDAINGTGWDDTRVWASHSHGGQGYDGSEILRIPPLGTADAVHAVYWGEDLRELTVAFYVQSRNGSAIAWTFLRAPDDNASQAHAEEQARRQAETDRLINETIREVVNRSEEAWSDEQTMSSEDSAEEANATSPADPRLGTGTTAVVLVASSAGSLILGRRNRPGE